MTRRAAVFLLLAAACAPTPVEAPPAAAPVSPPPTATAEVAATPPPAPPGPPPEVHVFAEGWSLSVGETRGQTILFDSYLGATAEVQGDEIRVHPATLAPVLTSRESRLQLVFGNRDELWALLRYPDEKPKLAHRQDGTWQIGRIATFEGYHDIWVTPSAPTHPVVVYGPRWGRGGTLSHVTAGAPGAALSPKDPPSLPVDGSLRVITAAANARGDAVVLGSLDNERKQHGIQRWPAAGGPPEVAPLPPIEGPVAHVDVTVCLSPAGVVHVVRDVTTKDETKGQHDLEGHAELATWDGKGWSIAPIPERSAYFGVQGCAVAGDGAVWVAWDANQERHPGDVRIDRFAAGKWARVPVPRLSPLPERIEIVTNGGGRQLVKRPIPAGERAEGVAYPSDIRADDAGTIWISAYRMDHGKLVTADVDYSPLYRRVVLRSGPARREPVFLWESASGDAVKRAVENANVRASGATRAPRDKPFAAATAGCKDVFVVIAAVPKNTATDYGFPLTAGAVKGRRDLAEVRYVEAIMSQKRVFGAMAPSFDAGKKLADVLSTAMPGAKPQVLCGEPFVTRTVKLASVP